MYKRQSIDDFVKTVGRTVSMGKSGYFNLMGATAGWGKISLYKGEIYSLSFNLASGSQGIVELSQESHLQFIFQDYRNLKLHEDDSMKSDMNNLNFFMFFGVLDAPTPQSIDFALSRADVEKNCTLPDYLEKDNKILVIDDSVQIRKALRRILDPEGYEIIEAEDGIKGLTIMYREKPDLVLLDVMMPELDGYQVLDFIRQSAGFETLPVIMLTARNSMVDVLKGKMSSLNAYLTKPVTREVLLKEISKHLK